MTTNQNSADQTTPHARGVDHVGITVPDVEVATAFFCAALGAVHLYDLIRDYELVLPPGQTEPAPLGFDLTETVGVSPDTKLRTLRLLRVGNGPSLELFEYEGVLQQATAIPSDFGMQHLAFYVDDIDAAGAAVASAGGQLLAGPYSMPGLESAPGALFRYARAPWGTMIELISYPRPQRYTETTDLRRWWPGE